MLSPLIDLFLMGFLMELMLEGGYPEASSLSLMLAVCHVYERRIFLGYFFQTKLDRIEVSDTAEPSLLCFLKPKGAKFSRFNS